MRAISSKLKHCSVTCILKINLVLSIQMPLQLSSHFIIVKGDKVIVTVDVTSWRPDPSPCYNIRPGLIQAPAPPFPGPGWRIISLDCDTGPGLALWHRNYKALAPELSADPDTFRICDICPVICNYFNLVAILKSISLLSYPPLP